MSPLGYPSNLLAPEQTYESVNETIGSIVLRNRPAGSLVDRVRRRFRFF